MREIIHMGVSVRWAIANLSRSRAKMAPGFTHDNGRGMTRTEAIDALMDELAKGREILPMGKACEGFDYKTGCPGHAVADEGGGDA